LRKRVHEPCNKGDERVSSVCSHWVVLAIGRAEISIGSLGWLLVIESEVAELSNGPLIGLDGTGHTHSYGRGLTFASNGAPLFDASAFERVVRPHASHVGRVERSFG